MKNTIKKLQKTFKLVSDYAIIGDFGNTLKDNVVEWDLEYACKHSSYDCDCYDKAIEEFCKTLPIHPKDIKNAEIFEEGRGEKHEQWYVFEYNDENYRVDCNYYEDEGVHSFGKIRKCKQVEKVVKYWEDIE